MDNWIDPPKILTANEEDVDTGTDENGDAKFFKAIQEAADDTLSEASVDKVVDYLSTTEVGETSDEEDFHSSEEKSDPYDTLDKFPRTGLDDEIDLYLGEDKPGEFDDYLADVDDDGEDDSGSVNLLEDLDNADSSINPESSANSDIVLNEAVIEAVVDDKGDDKADVDKEPPKASSGTTGEPSNDAIVDVLDVSTEDLDSTNDNAGDKLDYDNEIIENIDFKKTNIWIVFGLSQR